MEATVRQRDEELANKQQELEDSMFSTPRSESAFWILNVFILLPRSLCLVKKILKTYREDGRRLSTEAQEAIDEAHVDVQARVVTRRQEGGYSLEELEAERDELNASLECMINISPAVLEAYKKRKGEVSSHSLSISTRLFSLILSFLVF